MLGAGRGWLPVRDLLWHLGTVLDALLAARLVQLGLVRRYPVLCTRLCFDVARNSVLAYFFYSAKNLSGFQRYGVVYAITQPVIWALYFLLVLELYSLMLEDFPGIRRMGRVVMLTAVAASTVGCCLFIVLDEQVGFDRYPLLSYLVLQQRSVYLCLSALVLLLLTFVAHYRLHIRHNIWVLFLCFGSCFLVNALLFALRRYYGDAFRPSRDLVSSLCYPVALLGAVLFLSKAGETESHQISVLWGSRSRAVEAALSLQLQSFNQVLVKVLKP